MDKAEFESEELTATNPDHAEKTGQDENALNLDNESFKEDAKPNQSDELGNESLDSPSGHHTEKTESPNDEVSPNADKHENSQTDVADTVGNNLGDENPDLTEPADSDSERVSAESTLSNDSAGSIDEDKESDGQQESPVDTADDEKSPQAHAAKTSTLTVVMTVLLIGAVFFGFFLFDNKSRIQSSNKEKVQKPENQKPQLKPKKKTIIELQPEVHLGTYGSQINAVSALREILLKKQSEVVALKERYQQSIDELEKEILDEQRIVDIQTFLQASGNQRINFGLKTIQRRQAYITQLEKPMGWVTGACEDLLYLKRSIMIDLYISEVAAGIEMEKHVQNIRDALKKYQPTADRLAIDPTRVRLESLDKIWARIQSKQNLATSEPVYSKNQIIAEQICAGDFSRMGDLSEISTDTATCITEMNGSDLFLNHLIEISPGAARQLCRWRGSWICMNGIRALSPRVAHYLFQWNGEWISLNGLTEFPPEVAEMLLKWDGEQLELMGLPDTPEAHDKIGIEYLAEWERSGGKLFVPRKLREKINALHRNSG